MRLNHGFDDKPVENGEEQKEEPDKKDITSVEVYQSRLNYRDLYVGEVLEHAFGDPL